MPEINKKVLVQRNLLISQIKEYCPMLGDFFGLDKNLKEYSKSIYDFAINPVYIKRQKKLRKIIKSKIKKLFWERSDEELNIEFDKQLVINIVDHHQVLNHPILISDNIVTSISKFLQNKKQSATIVFSSGDVPPNNYFSKNGFILHGKKVPLFSNSEKELTSYYIPKRKFNFIGRLKNIKRWDEFNSDEKTFLEKLDKIITEIDFGRCENYNDQITLIVNKTWPLMFEEKLRSNLSELIYITQEEITTNALIGLLDEDNFISQFLFDEGFRKKVLDEFRGIVVTWREKEEKGTHFFWRKYPGENRSLRMYIEGNQLVPTDKRFKDLAIDLKKNTIINLLKQKVIYPSLFLIFAVNIFYFGVKPLAGHGSLTYLNLIKNAWLKVLSSSNFKTEIRNIETIKIDKLITGISLFFKEVDGKYEDMYAHDVMYDGGIKEDQLEMLFEMNYKDLLSVNADEIYDYVQQKYIPKDKKI